MIDQTNIQFVANTLAEHAQSMLMEITDGEPLDGDATEKLAEEFLKQLNSLNANI